jgi:hypothetical protein
VAIIAIIALTKLRLIVTSIAAGTSDHQLIFVAVAPCELKKSSAWTNEKERREFEYRRAQINYVANSSTRF